MAKRNVWLEIAFKLFSCYGNWLNAWLPEDNKADLSNWPFEVTQLMFPFRFHLAQNRNILNF